MTDKRKSLTPGTEIRIISGLMAGRTGTVRESVTHEGERGYGVDVNEVRPSLNPLFFAKREVEAIEG